MLGLRELCKKPRTVAVGAGAAFVLAGVLHGNGEHTANSPVAAAKVGGAACAASARVDFTTNAAGITKLAGAASSKSAFAATICEMAHGTLSNFDTFAVQVWDVSGVDPQAAELLKAVDDAYGSAVMTIQNTDPGAAPGSFHIELDR